MSISPLQDVLLENNDNYNFYPIIGLVGIVLSCLLYVPRIVCNSSTYANIIIVQDHPEGLDFSIHNNYGSLDNV